ncbi:MAG: flagellar hook-associated protein FlgK [Cereibacter sphaeroides]|uniref:Flagellar hook-associated protein 1 n=1 Tax=Cereibacter sphaeroides TaxID=1063 RepID=A0A2W5SCC5_CERSP|nr:MAG: flagellar hook-associated protein FlgK [Cereibacter sphaeroides]
MSLSVTLSSALSGLQANSRAAELVSTNIANALTDGYGQRELSLSARSLGGTGSGVRINGVLRHTDQVLLSDRRIAEANAAAEGLRVAYLTKMERVIGTPETASSLGQLVSSFDSALVAAASRPDSEARLSDVLTTAQALASQLNRSSATIQEQRALADDRIAEDVKNLNETLAKVADLNARILKQVSADRDASPLMDQRQQLIDRIAGIVPIKEIARENGQIALVTAGGAVLLDGKPAVLGFVPVGTVTADMTVDSGALSGLTMNGKPVTFRDGTGKMDGGTLATSFNLRDEIAPATQAQLDAVARDLIERLADSTVDPTLSTGMAGLFTDAGAAFDATMEVGLAGRLSINSAADPAQGGALWRLRDGIGALTEGTPGYAGLFDAMEAALVERRPTPSGGFEAGSRSFSGLVSDLLSEVSSARVGAQATQSYAAAKFESLRNDELSQGVDSDQQMQQLMLIEKAYAANAKVISAVDDMIQMLLEM